MDKQLIKDVLDLIDLYEQSLGDNHIGHINGFKKWIVDNYNNEDQMNMVEWEGKDKGRSPESVINTLIVHMGRYAKSYSKSAIHDTLFSTQDDFIYLITLRAFGDMSKMDLIKKNVHDKPAGMQIINRLIHQGLLIQNASPVDKRSKILQITQLGQMELDKCMAKIRQATNIVTGQLTPNEKLTLIQLLTKLNDFHLPIYEKNIDSPELIDEVYKHYKL